MNLYYEILNYFGSAVCHQIIERSLTYKNLTLPLCSRCTGLYFSFLISFISCLIVNRKYRDFISKRYVIFGIISIILMGTEVFIEFFNLLSLTNQIRLLTGLLVGNFLGLISSEILFFSLVIYLFIQSVLPELIINRKKILLSSTIFIAVFLSVSLLLTLAFLRSRLSLLKIF